MGDVVVSPSCASIDQLAEKATFRRGALYEPRRPDEIVLAGEGPVQDERVAAAPDNTRRRQSPSSRAGPFPVGRTTDFFGFDTTYNHFKLQGLGDAPENENGARTVAQSLETGPGVAGDPQCLGSRDRRGRNDQTTGPGGGDDLQGLRAVGLRLQRHSVLGRGGRSLEAWRFGQIARPLTSLISRAFSRNGPPTLLLAASDWVTLSSSPASPARLRLPEKYRASAGGRAGCASVDAGRRRRGGFSAYRRHRVQAQKLRTPRGAPVKELTRPGKVAPAV